MAVMLPTSHLAPGVVAAHSAPIAGMLDLGRYPQGSDGLAEQVSTDLEGCGFSSHAHPMIMPRKYAKLLMNLGNALEAASGDAGRKSELLARARDEARQCFAAAGIDVAPAEEDAQRRREVITVAPVGGKWRGGGSSWQTLARGTGRIESDYLNGEIVLLGRLHGVATPVNAMLQEVANRMARTHQAPGSMPVDELEALIS
jgi:2-dehydropantoate 2-reductase